MSDFLRRFAEQFAALDKDNLHHLNQLYTHDVQFTDPLHEVQGLVALRSYFTDLYTNVSDLHFEFHGFDHISEGEGYLRWVMSYRHPRLANEFHTFIVRLMAARLAAANAEIRALL